MTSPLHPLRLWIPFALLVCGACQPDDSGSDDDQTTDDDASATDDDEADCPPAADFPVLSPDPANEAWEDPFVEATCEGEFLVVRSNGIPAYEFVPVTPNDLQAQDHEWAVTLSPSLAKSMTDIPLLGVAGFAVNGLPIYGPNEAEFPDPYGDPIYNAIVDDCLGHTGGVGDYHYHALLVECVLLEYGVVAGDPSPVIGYAMDGFPIRGPWGCLDVECEETVEFRSSWEQTGDPTTYAWDNYAFVEKKDPQYLDRCNGRVEPDGSYSYHATEAFPYILGCYAGTPSDDAGGGGTGGEEVIDCADAAPGTPCCGDDVCDGPETADNCPADCE